MLNPIEHEIIPLFNVYISWKLVISWVEHETKFYIRWTRHGAYKTFVHAIRSSMKLTLLKSVKMSTIVGFVTFISRRNITHWCYKARKYFMFIIWNFMLSCFEHVQSFWPLVTFKAGIPIRQHWSGPEVIKLSMLNSAEHEIYPAHEC